MRDHGSPAGPGPSGVRRAGACGQRPRTAAGSRSLVPVTSPFLGSASGLTPQRLRAKRFRQVARDVYVLGDRALDLRTRVLAARVLLPDAVACGRTAALLHRLPIRDDGRVHLARAPGAPRSEQSGVVVHRTRLHGEDVTVDRDVPVTAEPRTWVDLAAVLDLESLVALGDPVLRRWGRHRLEAAVERRRGHRGVVLARLALPLLNAGADSPAESRARLRLHAAGFNALVHGVDVRDELGGWLATPDLADPLARVAVQHDGLVHLVGDPERRRQDIQRDELTRQQDWQVVVSTAVDDRQPQLLVDKVADAYRRSGRLRGAHVLPSHLR